MKEIIMTTTRKAPQDHKEPTSADEFFTLDGADLLRKSGQVKASDKLRLLGRLQTLGIGEGVTAADMDLDTVADFIDYVSERYAIDPEAFDDWSAQQGFDEALNLVIAYGALLGKAHASAI